MTKFLPTTVQLIRLKNQMDFFIENRYPATYAAYHLAILCQGMDVEVECDVVPTSEAELHDHMDILFQTLGYERVGDWNGLMRKINPTSDNTSADDGPYGRIV